MVLTTCIFVILFACRHCPVLLQDASYPCDELLDTRQLAGGVVPTFTAQAREMHPAGRYVLVAQSFSGHGTWCGCQ